MGHETWQSGNKRLLSALPLAGRSYPSPARNGSRATAQRCSSVSIVVAELVAESYGTNTPSCTC